MKGFDYFTKYSTLVVSWQEQVTFDEMMMMSPLY
jgi:hypothetical protein